MEARMALPTPSRRDEILARTGFRVVSPGDVDRDGDVDVADLGVVADQYGRTGDGLAGDVTGDGRVDHLDLGVVSTHLGYHSPMPSRLVRPVSRYWPDAYPFRGAGQVRFVWWASEHVLRQRLEAYASDPPHPHVAVWDVEGEPAEEGFGSTLARAIRFCRIAREMGFSPGVCSFGPWRANETICGPPVERANAIIAERLVPEADWLCREHYGPSAVEWLPAWLRASAGWDICTMPLLHPCAFDRQHTLMGYDAWADLCETARVKADATCLWAEALDRDAPAGKSPHCIYALIAMRVFGVQERPWFGPE